MSIKPNVRYGGNTMEYNAGYQPVKKPMNRHVKSACRGAALTAGCLSASTALSWATDSVYMSALAKKMGGKAKYTKVFARNLALATLAGAAASAIMSLITSKVTPKNPPRAAN